MKKIILAFLAMLLFGVTYSQQTLKVIGNLENGNAVLTINKGLAIAALNANLRKYSGLNVNHTDVKILKRDNKYVLVFSGGSARSSFGVKVEGTELLVDGKITCTTSDCASEEYGCVPEQNVSTGNWVCSECANKGKCTKTTSSDSLID